jgi:hypothetical protein
MKSVIFYPLQTSTHIQQMHVLSKGYMKFQGYYHEKEENFPLEQLLCVGKDMYWILIHSKTQSEMDTSGSFYDETVGGNICLFPSYTIELSFSVLLKNPNKEKLREIIEDIKADHELIRERENARWDAEYAARLKNVSKADEVSNVVGGEQEVSDIDSTGSSSPT